jgi:hypothetical protein
LVVGADNRCVGLPIQRGPIVDEEVVSVVVRASLILFLAIAAGACAGSGASNPMGGAGAGSGAGSGAAAGTGAAGTGTVADASSGGGSGGTSDGGGSAGTSSDAVEHAAAGATGTCATFALCDDFESANVQVGGKPDGTKWTVGAPNVTGTGALAIDDGQHHSGARSVKVTGQGGYSNHIFLTNSSAIATLGTTVWGRFYVRLADPLGDGHLTFLAMMDAHDGGKYLRMGGQAKILMWNRESDDATLPALSPVGIAQSEPLPTNQWLCLEFMVDGAQGLLRTWVDGAEIAGLHVDGTSTPDVDEQWLRKADWRPVLTDFALGWESYAGQAMTLWFDDVALDGARVGCL